MKDVGMTIQLLEAFRDRDMWKEGFMTHEDKPKTRKNICGYALETIKEQQAEIERLKEKDNPWRFFNFRKATEEEKEYYKEEYGEYNEGDADELEMIENVPGDGEEVLLWTGYGFTVDTYDDGMFEGAGEIEKGMAWRYLPKPPKDETH